MRFSALSLLVLAACSEREFSVTSTPEVVPRDAHIKGRVCDPVTQRWLEGAMVYTNLFDEGGVVYDTSVSLSDSDGRWEFTVPGERTYDVYVQIGNDVVEQIQVTVSEGETVEVPDPPCFQELDANVAVVTGDWDDLGRVFPTIGITDWTIVNGQTGLEIIDFLTDDANLGEYDALFFDGGHLEAGIFYGPPDDPTVAAVHSALRRWVRNGGYLFASDWSYDVIEQIWPDEIEFFGDDLVPDAAQVGEPGTVTADLMDEDLADVIQAAQIDLTYDIPVWPVAEEVGENAKIWMIGAPDFRLGFDVYRMEDSPLLVSFQKGDGRVVFSSFRLSVNEDENLRKSLRVLLEGVL